MDEESGAALSSGDSLSVPMETAGCLPGVFLKERRWRWMVSPHSRGHDDSAAVLQAESIGPCMGAGPQVPRTHLGAGAGLSLSSQLCDHLAHYFIFLSCDFSLSSTPSSRIVCKVPRGYTDHPEQLTSPSPVTPPHRLFSPCSEVFLSLMGLPVALCSFVSSLALELGLFTESIGPGELVALRGDCGKNLCV